MIVSVSGGKGGTGKSTVATNLAVLLSRHVDLVLADLDVEAPNDHLLLGLELGGKEEVVIMLPKVDYGECIKCGVCGEVCDTGAILMSPEKLPFVIPRLCSGCRSCYFACPTKAIKEGGRVIGYTYTARFEKSSEFGFVTGFLREGEEHTPPMVLATKRRAMKMEADLHLIDTSAGTSNNVSTAVEGSRLLIAVTEPTPLGLHDLKMMLELSNEMGVETWIVMNKSGIGPEDEHERVAREFGSRIVARIPYSRAVFESYIKGVPVVIGYPDSSASKELSRLAEEVMGL